MSAFDLMMPMIDVADRLPPAGQTVLLRGTSGYMRAGGLDVAALGCEAVREDLTEGRSALFLGTDAVDMPAAA